jgi:hypothetical protein
MLTSCTVLDQSVLSAYKFRCQGSLVGCGSEISRDFDHSELTDFFPQVCPQPAYPSYARIREEVRPIKSETANYGLVKYDFTKYISS